MSEREKRTQAIAEDGQPCEEFMDFVIQFQQAMVLYANAIKSVELRVEMMRSKNRVAGGYQKIHSFSSRIKEPHSIHKKLRKMHKPLSLDSMQHNLNDIAGCRIIVSYLEDVYMVRDELLKDGIITLLQEKDYIRHPKKNGYRSLHLIAVVPVDMKDKTMEVKVEIQIRTYAMDCWASLEHQLRYKKDLPADARVDEELAECARLSFQTDVLMQDILNRLKGKTDL